jgi:Mn-dependent DtxR family transcriptional regulator
VAITEPRRPATEGTLRPETVKHYLETIFYIQFEEDRVRPGRIAEWLGLRPPTVSVTLHRLERDGWIQVESDRTVSLTDEGMALASGVVRVHRLLERWLTDVLGFDWATADNYAQEIAPGMSDAVAERLDEHLGRLVPAVDRGRPGAPRVDQLSRDFDVAAVEVHSPHVQAARRRLEHGWALAVVGA